MVSFLALYRGPSLPSAELVAVTADPGLVAAVAGVLLKGRLARPVAEGDPALAALSSGRRRALQLVKVEAEQGVPE